MMPEKKLLNRYPKTARNNLLESRDSVLPEDRRLAREFDYEYFDGPRRLGLGGYRYIKGFWRDAVEDIATYYSMGNSSSILDVGCGKGFTLFEFSMLYPNIRLRGLEKSQYCINNSLPVIRPHIDLGCCSSLPYDSNSFDVAISIATIHNLDRREAFSSRTYACEQAIICKNQWLPY